jgi:endonuclease G
MPLILRHRLALLPGLLLLALSIAGRTARADPAADCATLLPGGIGPVYLTPPARHTELCYASAFTLSHDDEAHQPRWVAWVVTADHVANATVPRADDYRHDPALPPGAGATPADYAHSGYDQGHMSDAEDNAWSQVTERLSFLLSNMIPQCPKCNRDTWRTIEDWTREKALVRGTLYVLSGPVFGPTHTTIGDDRVWVPSASWKLVLDLDANQAWGFIVANDPAFLKKGKGVSPYLVSPHAVEIAAHLTLPIPATINRSKSAPIND